jgi:hypothetical protein
MRVLTDTGPGLVRWALLAACWVAIPAQAAGQPEPTVSGIALASDSIPAGDPVGALWRSAVLPGWGQAYNGQLYKTPIVLGLIGGMVGFAVYNDNLFDEYNEAYLYGVYLGEDPHPFPEYEDSYLKYPGVSTSSLRSRRDSHRRSRNLFLIGSVLAYGLNVLDAYVNGHLIGFDVGEDLSAGLVAGPEQAAVRIRMRF